MQRVKELASMLNSEKAPIIINAIMEADEDNPINQYRIVQEHGIDKRTVHYTVKRLEDKGFVNVRIEKNPLYWFDKQTKEAIRMLFRINSLLKT